MHYQLLAAGKPVTVYQWPCRAYDIKTYGEEIYKHIADEMAFAILTGEGAVEFTVGGKTCHIGGIAKGSGMIHPNMATTLTFLTTDCAIDHDLLVQALREVVFITLNRVSVDGDTSTNDMVCILSNGESGNEKITAEEEDYETFKDALYAVLMNLARKMAKSAFCYAYVRKKAA